MGFPQPLLPDLSDASSWRVDETYIKVKGQWRYLYRAVDKQGRTVDFLLSKNRDQAAAVRFFKRAISNYETPEKITLDGHTKPVLFSWLQFA